LHGRQHSRRQDRGAYLRNLFMSEPQQSVCRAVTQVSKAQPTQDGAGVSLFRAIGQSALRELDPF
jgi:hypothetical protein